MNRNMKGAQDRSLRQANLLRMMRPRRIAFVGGQQIAGPINACRRAGFDGEILAINPTRDAIAGIRCIPSIRDLDAAPDGALVALSPTGSIDAVAELRSIGAGGAVVIAAGFAELGAEGRARQDALCSAAGDMALLGPNCMGMLNQFDGAAIWGEDNHTERVAGFGFAIVSQSGALPFGMTNVEQALPLGYVFSVGNQAVLDIADCIEALLVDERVRAIGLYLEGIENGPALAAACERALTKQVPIIAIKGGDTTAGGKVAASHTAAMLVERDIWEAFAARYGIVEVRTPKALVETLKYLTISGLPKGNRVTAVSFSGGLNGLIAAQAGDAGLILPEPGPENAAKLRAILPENIPIANPLDLNVPFRSSTGISLEDGEAIGRSIALLAEGVSDQVLFFLDVPRADEAGLDHAWLPSIDAMFHVSRTLGLPCAVCGILPEGLEPALRRRLIAGGIAPLLGYGDTLTAVGAATQSAAAQRRIRTPVPPLLSLQHMSDSGAHVLDEAASKRALAGFGLKVPNFRSISRDEVRMAAAELGFPVAIKVLSTEILHKSRVGGVLLNLDHDSDVETALSGMIAVLGASVPGFHADRFLVERMVEGARAEYIIGIKRHPTLGLALMIGLGGTAVEQRATYRSMLLPLSSGTLETVLADLGVIPGSAEHRALAEAAQAVAGYALANCARVLTLDVNPVIVTANGEAVAADALIVLLSEGKA